jgi:type VI secretion system protein ImpB
MEDFDPENVAKQVKPIRELLDLRTKLADLRGSLQGNDKLEELLMDAVSSTEKLEKLKGEVKGADGNE